MRMNVMIRAIRGGLPMVLPAYMGNVMNSATFSVICSFL